MREGFEVDARSLLCVSYESSLAQFDRSLRNSCIGVCTSDAGSGQVFVDDDIMQWMIGL